MEVQYFQFGGEGGGEGKDATEKPESKEIQ